MVVTACDNYVSTKLNAQQNSCLPLKSGYGAAGRVDLSNGPKARTSHHEA